MDKESILFLCTGNSCRSQMAEGLAKKYLSAQFDIYSAGIKPKGVDPRAVKVMEELGIDISTHTSKTVMDLDHNEFNYVITVCGHANENCPFFPAQTKVIHKGFEDPPKRAENSRNEEEKLDHYRRVRDEILDYIRNLPAEIS